MNIPANKCLLRRVCSALLIGTGALSTVVSLLQWSPVSPLLGVGLIALGISWLMSRETGLIAISIPAILGIEGLIGLSTGIGFMGSLGLVWLAVIRFLEDYHA